ncbi:MAG: hypothetical protein ACT4QB_23010, partial [Gammaproteobacteria bacterium]
VPAPLIGSYDSVTPDDRRTDVPGGAYLSTANTDRRSTFLTDADVRSALREAIGTFRLTRPFSIEALLPAPANESARTRAYARLFERVSTERERLRAREW